MGQHGAWTSEVRFEDARVPAGALIGTPGEGYITAMRCLAHGRLHIAAMCVGLRVSRPVANMSTTFASMALKSDFDATIGAKFCD